MNTDRSVVLRSSPDLGFALREVRADRARTQADVAASVGLDRSQLAHMETGRAGRFLDNLLGLLGELGAQITITWSVPDRSEVSPVAEPIDREVHEVDEDQAARSHRGVAARIIRSPAVTSSEQFGEQFRRQHEAMQRVLEPILRQQEAMRAQARSAQASSAQFVRSVEPILR